MIAPPERVKVGPLVFQVLLDESEHQRICAHQGDYLYGVIRMPKQEIIIDPNLPLGQMQDTMLHEVMHAVWWVAGFRESEPEKPSEEEAIERTTSILLDTLQRNPGLTAFLMQQEES